MKIRTGFVSNSSSSSFIVTFDKIPESEQELKKILFGKRKIFGKDYNGSEYTTEQIAEIIWKDLCEKLPNNWLDIERDFEACGEDAPKDPWDDYCKTPSAKELADYDVAYKAYREEKLKQFVAKNKDKFTFVFEYGDHGRFGDVIENGDPFKNVSHMMFSKH
jgi:hypothetical protein